MFQWLNARSHKAFGEQLAIFYAERAVKQDTSLKGKKIASKQRDLLAKLSNQLETFKQANSMNFYQKAQLGNAFKWKLLDAGFESDYVEELTSWLVAQL